MKTKDIKPGVVYGYRDRLSGRIQPVVFLAKPGPEQLYRQGTLPRPNTPLFQHQPRHDKPSKGYLGSGDIGWPAVFGRVDDDDAARLTDATLDGFRATDRLHNDGVRYGVVTTPSRIVGPYDEAVAEEKRQREEEGRRHAEESLRRGRAQERAAKLVAALTSHGVTCRTNREYDPTALVIPLDDVEKLLGLLGGAS